MAAAQAFHRRNTLRTFAACAALPQGNRPAHRKTARQSGTRRTVHGTDAAADAGVAEAAPGATRQARSARGRICLDVAGTARVAVRAGAENTGDRVGETAGENVGSYALSRHAIIRARTNKGDC